MFMPEPSKMIRQLYIPLQRLPAPCLDRQKDHADESGEEETASGVDWRRRVGVASLPSNNGSAQTEETVEKARDTSSGTADRSREYFGRVYNEC